MSIIVEAIKLPFKVAKKGYEMTAKQVKKATPTQPAEEGLKQNFILDMSGLLTAYGFPTDESIKIAQNFYNMNKDKIKDVLAIL